MKVKFDPRISVEKQGKIQAAIHKLAREQGVSDIEVSINELDKYPKAIKFSGGELQQVAEENMEEDSSYFENGEPPYLCNVELSEELIQWLKEKFPNSKEGTSKEFKTGAKIMYESGLFDDFVVYIEVDGIEEDNGEEYLHFFRAKIKFPFFQTGVDFIQQHISNPLKIVPGASYQEH